MSDYRRPGVYLEEVLQTSPTQQGTANAVAVFAGVAPKGPAGVATRVDSWQDYVQKFGGFDPVTVTDASVSSTLLSYLPYAVFSFYQNGGSTAYIVRVLSSGSGAQGTTATIPIPDSSGGETCFVVNAQGAGTWGNNINVIVTQQAPPSTATGNRMVFGIMLVDDSGVRLETYNNLSMTGVAGTRPVLAALNDTLAGSQYIVAVAPTTPNPTGDPAPASYSLAGGADPGTPAAADLVSAPVTDAMRSIDAPLLCSFQPFRKPDGTYVMPPAQAIASNLNTDRLDCFVVWDGNPLALSGSSYVNDITSRAAQADPGSSYAAIYCPWIVTPNPAQPGASIVVPPSGSVVGMMARMDSSIGTWRTPAGLPAVLATAVATEVKFSDTDQGSLNYANINVIRAVQGSGICVMGGRTRKLYGPDRYVGARRTLIYIEDSLKLSTQFAVFENNDARLWSSLRTTANSILSPIWERRGLAGASAADAYYVVCDETINTPQVVQSGEVRMEVGVALQFPAEFVVIRISQFDSGTSLAGEVTAGVVAA